MKTAVVLEAIGRIPERADRHEAGGRSQGNDDESEHGRQELTSHRHERLVTLLQKGRESPGWEAAAHRLVWSVTNADILRSQKQLNHLATNCYSLVGREIKTSSNLWFTSC